MTAPDPDQASPGQAPDRPPRADPRPAPVTDPAAGPISQVTAVPGDGRKNEATGEADAGPRSDAELVAAVIADPAAFEALYWRYLMRVYRYARARLGTEQDAEDVTTATFMEAYQGLGGYEERGRFAAWLFTIAQRRVLAQQRRMTAHQDLEATNLAAPEARRQGDEDLILRRALARLTSERREVILLRFYADLKVHEIAQVLGKGDSAVKMLLSRGLAQLRDTIGEDPRG